ncbi:MAG: hypothetical protein ABJB03_06830 [Rhodoglobus sp.]
MALSESSVGILIERVGLWGHGDLGPFLMRAGVSKGDPGNVNGISRIKRAGAALSAAWRSKNEAGLIACALGILNTARPADPADQWVIDLVGQFRQDGYLVEHHDVDPVKPAWTSEGFVPGAEGSRTWTIEPLGSDELPLPPQVGSLQRELESAGLAVAANHFSQAYRAFTSGDLEASNSQLRPTFENVVIAIAARATTWRGTSGGAAIEALNQAGLFEKGEYDYTMGLWRMSHKNGSHPGLSNEDEALFRLTSVTALIRFLLHRFP